MGHNPIHITTAQNRQRVHISLLPPHHHPTPSCTSQTKKPSRSPRRAAPSRPRAAPPPAPLTLPTAHDPFSVPKSEPKGNMLFKAAALKATGISPADVKAATAAPKMAALFDDEKMAKLMPSFHSKMDGE